MGRKDMEQWIQEESQHLRDRVQTFKAEPFDPSFLLSLSMCNVICCLVFGQRFKYEDEKFLSLLQILKNTLRFDSTPWGQMYNVFPRIVEHLPGSHNTAFCRD
ncbi:hypothetical protein CesoFtcFv8_019082 [Champsocephalus esox]|uniref:Uncharacterized protein n=1 Tax=Champsocephalus esox TaxID=159716 RepID=A0AAN8GQE0_9TELE|nr:hypothetical protein CesoFtcFv8_019082 [Champsocephalus esox]